MKRQCEVGGVRGVKSARCEEAVRGVKRLSAISRVHLGCISAVSRVDLGYISPPRRTPRGTRQTEPCLSNKPCLSNVVLNWSKARQRPDGLAPLAMIPDSRVEGEEGSAPKASKRRT